MTVVQELTSLDTAVELGAERLLSLQHPDGWWKGELESNATMIAEHLFLLHFLGLRDAETDRLLANELLARRRDDGTWSIWFEGPPDLSVTVEAYAALKLAGVDAGEATRDYIRRAGGVPRARIFTRAFLALIGQWPWSRLAHVPVELILLPAQRPALGLRLRLLGAPDDGVAVGRRGVASGAPERDRPERDRRPQDRAGRPAAPLPRAAAARSGSPSAGCANDRRPTAPGAASSRRGSGR